MTIAGIVGSRTPLSDDAIISDIEAPKDKIERALCFCLLIVIFSPFLLALCELNQQKK
jgi:hypothetical protein